MASKFSGYLKSFWKWLTNKPDERILTRIDEDKIKDNEIIREQAKKIQILESQNSDFREKKRKEKIRDTDEELEQKLIEEINQKSQMIERKKFDGSFMFSKLFERLKKRRFAKKLEIVDRDDTVVFDKFADFIITPKGEIGILGASGDVWSHGENLNEIIYKPQSIENQIKRKRIQLPYDKNYRYIPDIESIEIHEIIYDEEKNEFRESEERMRPVKEMIVQREQDIIRLREYNEHLEQTTADLKRKMRDIKQALIIERIKSESSQSELSIALNNVNQFQMKIGELQRANTLLNQHKLIIEGMKERLEEINLKMMTQLEEEGSKTSVRRASDELQRIVDWVDDKLPKQIIQNIENKPELVPVKPGQSVDKTQNV